MMSKRKSDTKQACEMHIFRLEPKLSDCFFQETIKTKFCGHCEKTSSTSIKKLYEGPIFNKDRVASTPAFVLKSEKDKFKITAPLKGNENEQKYFQATQQKSQMVTLISQPQLVPKPSSKSFYCNVCKQKYQDYLQVLRQKTQHIKTPRHLTKIQNNPFNKHIIKLCSKYQKSRVGKDSKQKQKSHHPHHNQSTDIENLIIIDHDSLEEIQLARPRKKVKLDHVPRYGYEELYQQHLQNFCRFGQQAMFVDYIRSMHQYMHPMNPMNPINPMMNYPCFPPMLPMMGMPDPHHRNYDSMNKFYNQMRMPMMMPACPVNPSRRTDHSRSSANNMQVILIQDDL